MLNRSRLALLAILGLSVNAAANAPAAQPQRTVLERHEQSGVPGKDIVIGTAFIPPGTALAFHTHPGDESGYVLKGPLILKIRGQQGRILVAGTSFFIARGTVHSLAAPSSGDAGMAVSTWIVDQGAELATPVP